MVGMNESADDLREAPRLRETADVSGSFHHRVVRARNHRGISPRDVNGHDAIQAILRR